MLTFVDSLYTGDMFERYEVVQMVGDGACLYRTLSFLMFGDVSQHLNLRQQAVAHVCENWSTFQLYTIGEGDVSYSSVDEYRQSMMQQATYGSSCELQAISELYNNFRFEVYRNGLQIYSFGHGTVIKRLRFTGDLSFGHFDAYKDDPVSLSQASDDFISPPTVPVISRALNENKKAGRPKKNKGRPKTSLLTAAEQHRQAVRHYNEREPEKRQATVTKYLSSHAESVKDSVRRYHSKNKDAILLANKLYKQRNPEVVMAAGRRYKQRHPEVVMAAGRRYKQRHPEVVMTARRHYNFKNPDVVKAALKRYHSKKPQVLQAAIRRYHLKNPNVLKTAMRRYFSKNPKAFEAAIRRYRLKNPNVLMAARRRYHLKNPEVAMTAVKRYQHAHPECNRRAVRKFTVAHRDARNRSRRVFKVSLRAKRLASVRANKSVFKLSVNIHNVILSLQSKYQKGSVVSKRLKAEHTVKWAMHKRTSVRINLGKVFDKLKSLACSILSKIASLDFTGNDFTIFQSAFGPSLHVASQEPYSANSCYHTLRKVSEAIPIDTLGRLRDLFPRTNVPTDKRYKNVHNSWSCSPELCKFSLADLNKCTTLLRELVSARFPTKALKCKLLSNIALFKCYEPHFPTLRTFCRNVYRVVNDITLIGKIDFSLRTCNVRLLSVFAEQGSSGSIAVEVPLDASLVSNEDILHEQFKCAYRKHKSMSTDVPTFDCVSCHKLFPKSDGTLYGRLKKPLTTASWNLLLSHNSVKGNLTYSDFICRYCLGKYRENKVPPTSILNSLFVIPTPDELLNLNDYEKALIQRAKAFQVVVNMLPVGNKKIPNKQLVKKVKGRTFHLPLPLAQTLSKLPRPSDAVNADELYILMRGAPTKSKVVWQDLVDVNKVYRALTVLKLWNPLYRSINLPTSSSRLMTGVAAPQCYYVNPLPDDDSEAGPMVTQMDNKDDVENFYAQYTIYPIHETRKNDSASSLYQMLKVAAQPIDSRDKLLDVKCFPDLYFTGDCGQFHHRAEPLSQADFIKCRLKSTHAQFRLNQQYLFFLLNDANIRQLNAGIFYKLNVTNCKSKLTVNEYLDKLKKDELEGDLTAIFARLRNTEQFWKRPRNDVNCMTHHYGPATWFLTFSPSEWLWDDLGDYIKEVNALSWEKKGISELVALDPVSASRFIDIQFKAMLAFIMSEDHPIGEIEHFFWRREYQSRGTQHFHLMLWVKDAPVLGVSPTDDVVAFISRYLTCQLPDANKFPTLHQRVKKFQSHSHNSYCMRVKKTKKSIRKVCRFGFPRQVCDKLIVRNVAESIAGRKTLNTSSRLYSLPRSAGEGYINDYNPAIMLAWNGNMDLQYVGEKSAILNFYITKYTTKCEKGHTMDAFEQINSTKSLSSRLFNIGMRTLNHRECGALEASDTLLGIPLHGTDPKTSIRWLDTNMNRNRRVKPRNTVEALNPDSTDLFFASWVDDYYPSRPEIMNFINLYDFYRFYDKVYSKPKKSGSLCYSIGNGQYIKKRSRPYLINHYRYNHDQNPEQYFHSLLLMFKPWRNLSDLLCGHQSYAEAFHRCKEELIAATAYSALQDSFRDTLDQAFQQVNERIAEMQNESADEEQGPDHPDQFQHDQLDDVLGDLRQINVVAETDANVDDMIAKLNIDQLRVFNSVRNAIEGKGKPLRHFVSGTGGTGKSFLIATLKAFVTQKLGLNVAISAPTGVAAFNVNGLTIFRLLQLPVEHGATPKYSYLSDLALQKFRIELKETILFIVDEVSMVSNLMLLYINLRMSEIFGTCDEPDGWFGKKHILVLGDLLQLPPVRQSPPFEQLTRKEIEKYVGSLNVINLWGELFSYDELTINMRQKDDPDFVDTLMRVRLGAISQKDIDLLNTRRINMSSSSISVNLKEIVKYLKDLPDDTVCLMPTRNMCSTLNEAMLEVISSPVIELKAQDSVDCCKYLKKKAMEKVNKYDDDCSMTAGLETVIKIKIGAKVMLRRNIDVSKGLVNGSIGTLLAVNWEPANPNVPNSLTIQFSHGLLHDLLPIKAKFLLMPKVFIHRTQFAISVAYAITIHKSQGLSLRSVVLDIGSSIFSCGQAYVALSRVVSLQGLHLINFDPSQVKALESATVEINRLRCKYRPDLQSVRYMAGRKRKIKDTPWSTSKGAVDAQLEQAPPQPRKRARRRRKN